jgi:hypothetical protein
MAGGISLFVRTALAQGDRLGWSAGWPPQQGNPLTATARPDRGVHSLATSNSLVERFSLPATAKAAIVASIVKQHTLRRDMTALLKGDSVLFLPMPSRSGESRASASGESREERRADP